MLQSKYAEGLPDAPECLLLSGKWTYRVCMLCVGLLSPSTIPGRSMHAVAYNIDSYCRVVFIE